MRRFLIRWNMPMHRFAQIFVLIVAAVWIVEITRSYFQKRRRKQESNLDQALAKHENPTPPAD
jgi:hypothetical protein